MTKLTRYVKDAVSSVVNVDNHRNVEIFKLLQDIKTPTFIDEKKVSNCDVNDFILIIGDEVWIQDKNEEKFGQYIQAIYGAEFVRINPLLFEKQ
jgi:hypothetical protein